MEKHRYMVTLDQDAAFATKKYLSDLGLPATHFNVLLNEYLVMINPTLQLLVEKKKSGKQVTLFEVLEQASKAAAKMEKT